MVFGGLLGQFIHLSGILHLCSIDSFKTRCAHYVQVKKTKYNMYVSKFQTCQ